MPVPLIAAAGAAPAAVRGVTSGVKSVLGAVGLGAKRLASGVKDSVYDREVAQIQVLFQAGDAAGLQRWMAQTNNDTHPWGGRLATSPEARADAQTALDQLISANRSAASGGAPAPLFAAGATAATSGSSYQVGSSNLSSASAAGVSAGLSTPLLVGGALAVGALVYFFVIKKK